MSEPLVLLPGMNCSARLFGPVRQRLGQDLPGLELVDGPLVEPSLDECVDALLAQLPPRFALAGLSLGGIVAMALVRRAPQRVTRLCLMSTNARPPREDQRAEWQRQRRQLAGGRTAREVQQDLLPVLLHPGHRTPELESVTLAMADETGEDGLARQLALQCSRVDERPGLARVAVPTHVIAAEFDALCPVERHEEIAALVPGARLRVLPGIGHLSPLEAPDRVADELSDWLAWD